MSNPLGRESSVRYRITTDQSVANDRPAHIRVEYEAPDPDAWRKLPLLTHVEDLTPTAWLSESITTFGVGVKSFLPGHFEAYARLLPKANARHGSLPAELIDPLIESLKPATTTPDSCLFALWEGYDGSFVPSGLEPKLDLPHRRYHVFAGPIEAALTPFQERGQSANLWWPSDHAWCVASEIDFMWTYIGGSRQCIDSILADSRLETIETTAGSRS